MRKQKKIKVQTTHQRACRVALIYTLLRSTLTWITDRVWLDMHPYIRVILCSLLPLAVVLFLYDRMRKVDRNEFYRLRPITPDGVAVWILFGIGANSFATMLNLPVQRFLSGFEAFEVAATHLPATAAEYIIGIFVFCLLPAVLEELFCRGIILREYERYGTFFAVVAAASMFAVLHMTVASFVFTWVLGIVLAVVVLKTNSVYPAIIMHFSVNLFSLTRNYLTYLMPPIMQELWMAVQIFVLGLCAFGFVFAMAMLVKLNGKAHIIQRDYSQRFGISISFILLISIYILHHIRLLTEMIFV